MPASLLAEGGDRGLALRLRGNSAVTARCYPAPMNTDPTAGEDLARALAMALVRKGLLSERDIIDAAERANDGSERGGAVADLLLHAVIEADGRRGPASRTEVQALARREQIRVRTALIELERQHESGL